jgi:D-beta-D-heptose 7-phosphate kinase/D-beta-D-heptose 1-phosphate adenosyltransferase
LNGLISQASPDMVVFSDYAKWCLNQSVIQCAMQYAPALVDTKPGTASLFSGATIIKPNFKEFLQMCWIQAPNTNETIGLHGPQLARKLQTNLVVTRSEMGASFVDLQWKVKHIPSLAQDIFDVTGAGDTFMAALAVGISEWMSEWHAVDFGNRASAVAVSHIGTAVVKRLDVPNPTIPEFFE